MGSGSKTPTERAEAARQAKQSAYELVIDIVLTGLVIILPLVITLYVLDVALGFVTSALEPFIKLLVWANVITPIAESAPVQFLLDIELISDATRFLTHIIAVFILGLLILAVGSIGRLQYGEQLIDYIDAVIVAIPGVGAIYQSFRQMGDMVLENGTENFQEVKLVEFPYDGVYVLGFETARSPPAIRTAASMADEDGMLTLFLPLAPNPVMGGFLAHIPEDRVRPVDMTVEQAVRTIITSGIATEDPDRGEYRQLRDDEADVTGPVSEFGGIDGDGEEGASRGTDD